MTVLEDRQSLARSIEEAHQAGARLHEACKLVGLDLRTLQRWKAQGLTQGDRRPTAVRQPPAHALSPEERAEVLRVANEPRFADVPPARIVPMLADEGVYLASESSFARVLRAAGMNAPRGRAKAPQPRRPPTTHVATAPNQVWCWDVTYLPTTVRGVWLYLYLILDLFSRKIIAWEVHDRDDADHAVELLRRAALREGLAGTDPKPWLHGDNGATLKATSVLAMLHWLGIKPSYSRPRVSDDNPFAEALIRTLKYRPEMPPGGFGDLVTARAWAAQLVDWYQHHHRHSALRYVTPDQRHQGRDHQILQARHHLYLTARELNPARWSRHTRNWTPIGAVTLNPEKDAVVAAHCAALNRPDQAA